MGLQPIFSLARVMSACVARDHPRQGKKFYFGLASGDLDNFVGQLHHRKFLTVSNIDGP
jgi:hypothetical protein